MPEMILVPSSGSAWHPDVVEFALRYNVYERHGGFDSVANIANNAHDAWAKNGTLPDDVETLRCALFFERRRFRHFDSEPTGASDLPPVFIPLAELAFRP
ncbi:MAG: hypothetical protein FJW27_20000 [Acidimicrobiia bacterium]|nr:hypothetical protein [Acidimicrobiia bacterium]